MAFTVCFRWNDENTHSHRGSGLWGCFITYSYRVLLFSDEWKNSKSANKNICFALNAGHSDLDCFIHVFKVFFFPKISLTGILHQQWILKALLCVIRKIHVSKKKKSIVTLDSYLTQLLVGSSRLPERLQAGLRYNCYDVKRQIHVS